ncbi:hypothetical protein YC2023_089406 [Brassica napus]
MSDQNKAGANGNRKEPVVRCANLLNMHGITKNTIFKVPLFMFTLTTFTFIFNESLFSGGKNEKWYHTIQQVRTLITIFELTNKQAEELKGKLSGEAYKQLNRDSVCQLKANESVPVASAVGLRRCLTLISVIVSRRMMTTSDVIESFME